MLSLNCCLHMLSYRRVSSSGPVCVMQEMWLRLVGDVERPGSRILYSLASNLLPVVGLQCYAVLHESEDRIPVKVETV